MRSIKLEAFDLNLLLVFDALASERSVTQAAAKIGLSQPALSNALARLRELLGDPLFERVAGRMQPTLRARQLLAPLNEAIAKVREALETQTAFRPEVSEREFVIATNDYLESRFLSALVRRLRKEAPLAAVRTVRTDYLFLPPTEELRAGELDLAIGFFGNTPQARADLLSQHLADDRLVCILRDGHPRAKSRFSLSAFAAVPHVRILYPRREQFGSIDPILRSHGLTRRIAATVPHYSAIPPIVAQSDLLGVVPEVLARKVSARLRLRIYDPPVALPNINAVMMWHERRQFDRAHCWFRERVVATVGKLNASSGVSRPTKRAKDRARPAPRRKA